VAHQNKGNHDRAIADASEHLRLDPDSHWGYKVRAASHRAKGNLDLAIADYSDVIRLQPDTFAVFLDRGLAYREKGDRERAVSDLREPLRRYPSYQVKALRELQALGAEPASTQGVLDLLQ
jgi:tetratricopeptide (TPR) repeat protein